jgi:hypothetical protein
METTEILDDRIRCLSGAFTAEECADFVRRAEAIGFREAPITTATGFVMASATTPASSSTTTT